MVSVQQLWKREYSDARCQPWPNKVDPVQFAAFRLREKLRSISVLRPGQRILPIPSFGVQTSRRAVQSAAADWWPVTGKTCVAAYQPKGAASYAASKVNLASPSTYDAGDGTAYPTWEAATGWTGNGSTQYLTTGIVPAGGYSMLIRISNNDYTRTDSTWCGQYADSKRFDLGYYQNKHVFGSGSEVVISSGANMVSGVVGIAGQQGYLNGSALGGVIGFAGWTTTNQIYIFNRAGAASFAACKVQAFALYSDTLTAGEMATVSAAMAAL